MENTTLTTPTFQDTLVSPQDSTHTKLVSFCTWISDTHPLHIPPLCTHLTNRNGVGIMSRQTHGGDQVFITRSEVIGSLGGVLLLLLLIAVISCIKEHRRIQVG